MTQYKPLVKRAKTSEVLNALLQKSMMISLLMGFSSGLPLLLCSKTLQTWMSYTGGTAQMVGFMAIVSIPYGLKFLWAPLMDRFSLSRLGRRRSWLLLSQLGVLISVAALSRIQPVEDLSLTMLLALAISFFGASQDIVIDAYRRESLKDEELGLGSSFYSMGYRIAVWIAGGLALILASRVSWNTVYLIMAGIMIMSMIVTLWADEPVGAVSSPRTLQEAVYLPLKDFFSRHGAVIILIFILLYKVGDAMAGNMLPKFYEYLGFSSEEVGVIAKTMGPVSFLLGTFIGGIIIFKTGIYRSLFIFGVLQALSTLSFVALDRAGHNLPVLTGVVFFEDLSAGMGSAAFMAFMASLTNKSFTAMQYALMTSLMALPRTLISSGTGYMVAYFGWSGFFIFCALAAIPGLALILHVYRIWKADQVATSKQPLPA